MQNSLTPKQISKILAEVERLPVIQPQEVEIEQLQGILQKLNLPNDFLDEALIQVYRKQISDRQKRRIRWLAGIGVGAIALCFSLTSWLYHRHQQALNRISIYDQYISLGRNDTQSINSIERQANSKVYYKVTLKDAPIGKQLQLGCNWVNPSREIAYKNRWQTPKINQEIWDTVCSYQFNVNSPTGSWIVQITLDDEVLTSTQLIIN